MIPKTIHYIWLGGGTFDEKISHCIHSWDKLKKAGFSIKRWDESNLDLENLPPAIRKAFDDKKYAFVSDYVRLKVLYDNGGIYFDTDVEVVQNFDQILEQPDCMMLLGYIFDASIGTAVIGSEAHNKILRDMISDYESATVEFPSGNFRLNFPSFSELEIVNNNDFFTAWFLKYVPSFRLNGKFQIVDGIYIYPKEVFEGYALFGENFTIHHCFGSWYEHRSGLKSIVKKFVYGNSITAFMVDQVLRRRKLKRLPFYRNFDN